MTPAAPSEAEAPTVEQAVRVLAATRAFGPADAPWFYAIDAQLRVDRPLTHDQRRRAHRTLSSYREQLRAAGVDYDLVPAPDGDSTVPPHVAADRPPAAPLQPGPNTRSKAWVDAAGRLWVKNPYELRTVAGALPGAQWRKHVVAWELPATPSAALNIDAALRPTGLVTNGAFDELLERGQRAVHAQVHRSAEELTDLPGRTPGWLHQRQAYHFTRALDGSVLDMEMGTGKSRVVVGLAEDWQPSSMLIVCPERVVGVWPKQLRLHGASEYHVVDPRRQKRTGGWELLPIAKRVELYDSALHDCGCGLTHVLLTNYAAAGHAPFADWSLRQRFDLIAYDECHRIRAAGGAWSKWAHKMVKKSGRRVGGTGTLQAQTPLDVFGQFRAVDPGIFGLSQVSFRNKYAIMGGYGDFEGKVFRGMNPATEPEFVAKVASITYHAGEDVLDLPPVLELETAACQLAPAGMKAYRQMEQELVAELRIALAAGGSVDDVLTTDNALTKRLRLLQLAGGVVVSDSGLVAHVDDAKARLLIDVLEDLPEREPVVVYAKFHPDLDAIERAAGKLGRQYRELSGRRSDALTQDATLHPDATIAGVQIQAGGTGVDFTRSAYAVYYSTGDSLSDYLQSRKRLIRPGQERSVRIRHLLVEGTVEEDVVAALAARESVVNRIAARIKALQGSRR